MKKTLLPAGWTEPPTYCHAIEVDSASKTVYLAGQIGVDASGNCGLDIEAQTRVAYANIETLLAEAGMSLSDIVKMTVFLVNPEDRAKFSEARAQCLKGHKPPSTLVYVKALVDPAFLVEVEVIAAK